MKRPVIVVSVFAALVCAIWFTFLRPQPWEHGWKNAFVVTTRYDNDVVGFNVGLRLPLNCGDSDTPALFRWIEAYGDGGWIYQGGGAPCAEIFVVYKGVTDPASADRVLPGLVRALSLRIATGRLP